MKAIKYVVLIYLVGVLLSSCQSKVVNKNIEVKEMRDIAELATVECYYHNVAKSNKALNPAKIEFWKKKNMRFWVEYDGIVKIGIDASKLKMTINDNTVAIVLPEAIVLDVSVNSESLNEDSFYYDPSAKKPNIEEQTEAFAVAQEEMRASAEANSTLLANARENAKELLENYVKTIGEATGIEYKIEWVYVEDIKE